MRTVVLYSRVGCHLCDEARSVIETVRAHRSFRFEEIDIEGDDGLLRDLAMRIPVVTVDGEERFELVVDPAELAASVDG
jgi:glutaredoxin